MNHLAFAILFLRKFYSILFFCLIFQTTFLAPSIAQDNGSTADDSRLLEFKNIPSLYDFDGMFQRRLVRFLVPYSRTYYYNDKGHARGLIIELVQDFERYINKKYKKKLDKRPITVATFPTTRDKLLLEIQSGLGDIAAGSLVETPERLKLVDFYSPSDLPSVSELVVNNVSDSEIKSVEELSGKTVQVRKSSSHYEHLSSLNQKLISQGKAPIKLELVPDALEGEDMMEMVGAKLLENIVVDDRLASLWIKIIPNLRINKGAVVNEEGHVGWAFRVNSPQLRTELEDFYKSWVKKQGVIEYRYAQFAKKQKRIKHSKHKDDWKRFEETLDYFKKYGEKYNFDPLMLAAQGYQESQLNQKAKSPVGAIGIMQLMPATGKELKVGDIRIAENNIHAGAKYMDGLMRAFFSDAKFESNNRTLFAFASYNAGPNRIAGLRNVAAARGLDPNTWFNNVEIVVAEKVGIETTTYVRNIFKYYVAYRLQKNISEEAEKAKEKIATDGKN